ncbi:MAG: hypothetical protein K5905_09735, partial [Roseibium sp.]|nr:hypothetical protein [Roseibium sp.]
AILAALKNNWSASERDTILREYQSFLHDAVRAGEFRRPSRAVDCLWHEHILHTELYARYCHEKFGRYIHHMACIPPKYRTNFEAAVGRVMHPVEELETGARSGMGEFADCGPPAPPDEPSNRELRADCGSGNPPAPTRSG